MFANFVGFFWGVGWGVKLLLLLEWCVKNEPCLCRGHLKLQNMNYSQQ